MQLGSRAKKHVAGSKVRRGRSMDSQEMGEGRARSLPEVFCCRARVRLGLGLCQQRERRSASSLPGFLAGIACVLAGGACWSWVLGKCNMLGVGRLGGDHPWDP